MVYSDRKRLILISFLPMPWASYQCSSTRWIVPSSRRTVALPYEFSPAACAVGLPQAHNISNEMPDSDGLGVGNLSDDLEDDLRLHGQIV
jgi:hypothetical protein